MGGPETRSATRCDGRSVFARVAKPVVEAGKRFFHRLTAAILTRSYQLSEVLKKAQQNAILRYFGCGCAALHEVQLSGSILPAFPSNQT